MKEENLPSLSMKKCMVFLTGTSMKMIPWAMRQPLLRTEEGSGRKADDMHMDMMPLLWSSIFVTRVAKNISFPFMTLSVSHRVYDIDSIDRLFQDVFWNAIKHLQLVPGLV